MMRRAWLVLLLCSAACGPSLGVAGVGLPVRPIRPEDRVLLGDFSRVNAVAAAFDRVFVAYPTALGIYGPIQRRWEVPRSPSEPRWLDAVFAAVVDGVDQSVWLATPDGWIHYRAEIDLWERALLPGRVQAVAIDAVDPARGIWFQTSTGWLLQPRTGGAAMPATPPRTLRVSATVDDAMRDMPQLRALAPTLATGPRLSTGRLTTAAPAADGAGWYLGTSTRGLLYFDRTGAGAEPFPLGLPAEGVGALVAVDDGVWVATDATPALGAQLTRLSSDLTRSESVKGLPTTGLPFDAARRLLLGDGVLWVGSDRGVVRVMLPGGGLTRFDEGSGLPDQRVTALVQRRGQLVVGTLRGLAAEVRPGVLERQATKFFGAVYALAARGDTVWAGTIGGLAALLPGDDDLRIPDGLRQLAGGNAPVYGVGYVADTLVAMTADRLLWRDPQFGVWTPGPQLSLDVGRLTVMSADADGIWVGGLNGVALVRPTFGALRVLRFPGELPGQVTSLARSGQYLWVGTVHGLVRFLLEVR